MPYITDPTALDNMVTNIVAREAEVASYQTNIDNYTLMLAALPTEWPTELVQYKGLNSQQIVATVPAELRQQVSDLCFKDQIEFLKGTEALEKSKATIIYNAMASQVDPANLADLVTAKKAELAAQ